MEHQPGFSEFEFAGKRKTTRREKVLAEMEITIPWDELLHGQEIQVHADAGYRLVARRGGPGRWSLVRWS